LPDGTRLTLDSPQLLSKLFTRDFAAYIAALIAAGLLGSIWAVTLAVRPLRRLSDAADRFGADVNAAPMPETGPREVRQAAAASTECSGGCASSSPTAPACSLQSRMICARR